MTDNLDIDAIEARAKAATPGGWHVGHIDENLDHAEIVDAADQPVATVYRRAAEPLICSAFDSTFALCARVREIEADLEIARNEANIFRRQLEKAESVCEAAIRFKEGQIKMLAKYLAGSGGIDVDAEELDYCLETWHASRGEP